jgi:hypothetical protein
MQWSCNRRWKIDWSGKWTLPPHYAFFFRSDTVSGVLWHFLSRARCFLFRAPGQDEGGERSSPFNTFSVLPMRSSCSADEGCRGLCLITNLLNELLLQRWSNPCYLCISSHLFEQPQHRMDTIFGELCMCLIISVMSVIPAWSLRWSRCCC